MQFISLEESLMCIHITPHNLLATRDWRFQELWQEALTSHGLSISVAPWAPWKWKSLSRVWLFVTPRTTQSMEFSRPEYWSGEPFTSPGDLPNPGIEPRSPTLRVDSLPAEPPGKPKILEWLAYPFSRGSSWPRNRTRVSYIAGRFWAPYFNEF